MANSQAAVFKFESNDAIRSVLIDGSPWFVAQDVCTALRIQNVTQALDKLDDDERSMLNIGHEHRSIFDKRVKEINIVSESGLYTLILRCRDAVTPGTIPYRFRKWVTGEVLPQIRQTGRYIREELSPADKAQKVVASFMPAILEAMKSEGKQEYNVPLKPGYREHIHSPEGVLGLAEHSLLMNLLNRMQDDGHDVSGAAAEFTTMVSYIVGVSKCLNDIRTHAQYITKNTAAF
ncbi:MULTISPECIES: Bro-N domain-containing protein [Enterobacter]|uniref:BRO-N domain-containing protein n=1 Tax=Enterobacter TaxID=547 RepID=UPI0007353106|nr:MULTISPECIES: BRO family protein [Enterobacter cloacae complex]KAA0899709.1 BRO-like protein [Enterobacter hormaechei]KAA0903974.1 BRO-like protein [Enterobacter hormaechei]KTH92035.1 BRO-like protein [Enterobacter hormaechei subsp. steigerwaltii]KTI01531.1 BRO-like protein [Enterobacter hormaechei subsp. steigerwaltii]KTI73724.1 BRO-like protein [Enterobacter hormaechei subsp. steigerwaltii]